MQIKRHNIFILILILTNIFSCTQEVKVEHLKMVSYSIHEIPDTVSKTLIISHNPKNSNPWGENFWTMNSFQNLDTSPNRFSLKVDKYGGASGYRPSEMKMNGYNFILFRKFQEGEPPYLLFNQKLYFLVKNSHRSNLDSSTVGIIDLSGYLKN